MTCNVMLGPESILIKGRWGNKASHSLLYKDVTGYSIRVVGWGTRKITLVTRHGNHMITDKKNIIHSIVQELS